MDGGLTSQFPRGLWMGTLSQFTRPVSAAGRLQSGRPAGEASLCILGLIALLSSTLSEG